MRKRTITEAAYIADVCDRTIMRLVDKGELAATKIDGRVWISDEDLRAYVQRRTVSQLQKLARITRFTEGNGPVAA